MVEKEEDEWEQWEGEGRKELWSGRKKVRGREGKRENKEQVMEMVQEEEEISRKGNIWN